MISDFIAEQAGFDLILFKPQTLGILHISCTTTLLASAAVGIHCYTVSSTTPPEASASGRVPDPIGLYRCSIPAQVIRPAMAFLDEGLNQSCPLAGPHRHNRHRGTVRERNRPQLRGS